MAVEDTAHEQLEAAQASYERCRHSEAFLADFYEAFLGSDPAIGPLFAHTDFDRQRRLLTHAMGLLFSFARRPNPNLLERIATRHGPAEMDIPAHYYPRFMDALLLAVQKHDPEATPATAEAWRAALAPGIRYMERYGR